MKPSRGELEDVARDAEGEAEGTADPAKGAALRARAAEVRAQPSIDYNYSAIVVGPPGFGKTSLQVELIKRHLRETPGIVLAHDPLRQFVREGCAWYSDAAAWRLAARKVAANPKLMMPRGASIGGTDSDEITDLAMELGARLNSAKRVRVPILVPYDEGSLREGSGSTFISAKDNQFLALRRHKGVLPIFNLQDVRQLTERFYRMSTDVYLFRQTSDRARTLDNLLLLEKGTLEREGICALPKHSYIHVRIGEGVVGDAL